MVSKLWQYFRPISISLSPNTEKDDVWLAFKLLWKPWRWKDKKPIEELEDEFKKYLGIKYAFTFNSGRSSLLAILSSLGLEERSEVLTQAFTCNAAVNPILWAGLNPVYVDCSEETFNIDVEDLKRKITSRSKVLIVQHTFGLSAEMDEILEIARKNNLILIEDCAHALGAEYKQKKVGTFGKASFFSFSRDKVISCVYGGMVCTDSDNLAQKIKVFQKEIGDPSFFWTLQQLLHPVLMELCILPTYRFLGLGKVFLIFCQKFHILSKAVHWQEKRGKKPLYFPKRLPSALALLALNQFKKLDSFWSHRKKLSDFYYRELKESSFQLPDHLAEGFLESAGLKHSFLRFTVKHPLAHTIIKKAWQKNILIGDWYASPIAPADTQLDKEKYQRGCCPKAEKLSKTTFNLPTHHNISFRDAKHVVNFIKKLQ